MTLEVLAGDFKGDTARRRHRARRRPRRLRAQPRDRAAPVAPGARAGELPASATRSSSTRKQRGAVTKTGLMLGLGEELDEVRAVLRELRGARRRHPDARPVPAPVAGSTCRSSATCRPTSSPRSRPRRWPLGFPHVESGPLVALELPRRRPARHRARAAGPRSRGRPGSQRARGSRARGGARACLARALRGGFGTLPGSRVRR